MNIFEILDPGLGATLQDRGRFGWRRFGVPCSGAMDQHAADWANKLLDNPPNAAVIELLLQGARLRVLHDTWIAITGADAEPNAPMWRVVRMRAGEVLRFPHVHSGVWSYIAVEGGFDAKRLFGSASVFSRGGLGSPFRAGNVLRRTVGSEFSLPPSVAGRSVAWDERRDYESPPPLRLWPGPQWGFLGEADHQTFFSATWTVASASDRIGYRLNGDPLKPSTAQIVSEPLRPGMVQIPESGLPIITMRDGPTVGGYPKLGVVDAEDLSWLAQCRPGQKVRFTLVSGSVVTHHAQ